MWISSDCYLVTTLKSHQITALWRVNSRLYKKSHLVIHFILSSTFRFHYKAFMIDITGIFWYESPSESKMKTSDLSQSKAHSDICLQMTVIWPSTCGFIATIFCIAGQWKHHDNFTMESSRYIKNILRIHCKVTLWLSTKQQS